MSFRTRLKRLWEKTKANVTKSATTTVNVPTTPESHIPKVDQADLAVFVAASTTVLTSSNNIRTISSLSVIPKHTPEILNTQNGVPKPSQDLKLNNLWDEAYNELRKEDSKLVDAYERGLFAIQDLEQKAPEGEDREIQLQNILNSKIQDIENSQMKISLNGKDVVIRDQVRKVVQSILSAKGYIGTLASTEPHAALAWTGVMILLPVIAHPITQDDDALEGLEYISELLVRCKVTEDTYRENLACTLSASNSSLPTYLLELNVSFRAKAVSIYSQVLKYQIRLSQQYSRSGLFRYLRDCVIADDWRSMLESIKGTETDISKVLDTFDSRTLKMIGEQVAVLRNNADKSLSLLLDTKTGVEKINQSQLLGKLHRAEYASFNTFTKADHRPPRCLEGTRVDILREIVHWGNGHREECICWVRSFAGTGKSTLARTIAHHFNEEGRLGASFFFSRGKKDLGDTTAVLTTIAVQLAEALPDLRSDICEAVEKHGDIGQQPLYNQWQKLILQPLIRLDRKLLLPVVLVFVLDALDECEGDEHLDEILQLLPTLRDLEVLQVKVLLTSRPERSIYASFRELPDIVHHDLTLHSVPKVVIDGDISIFLRHELGKIKSKKRIERSWPGDESIQTLVHKAGGLFIYAATVCRFVAESRFPEKRMTKLLEAESMSRSSTGELDKMYSEILEHGLGGGSDEDQEEMKSLFKQIVGALIVLFEGLPKSSLTSILDLPSSDIIEVLESLHSVLDVPDDESSPIQLFHLSFRDFLFSEERCANPGFTIQEEAAHDELLTKCLNLMSKHLKQDICDLRHPGTSVAAVKKSSLETFLPPEVQYACKYWIHHLQKSPTKLVDHGAVHIFLRKHLLHWIETLSLMGIISEGIVMVRVLETLLREKSYANSSLFSLVYDTKRFILKFRSAIEIAPLQIYSSALVFSPRKSKIREQFWDHSPSWIVDVISADEDWNPSLLTLEHSRNVIEVFFSPDGQLLISSGGDIAKAWDITTGALRGTFPDILPSFISMGTSCRKEVLSPDGKFLACTSVFDNKIRLWDLKRVAMHSTLEGHIDRVSSVAFSPNSEYIASVSSDETMRLWNIKTGHSTILLGEESDIQHETSQALVFGIPSNGIIIFSPNGKFIAGYIDGHNDHQVRIWDAQTNCSLGTLPHSQRILTLEFSPDGTLIASSCLDGAVRIWDPCTATLCRILMQVEPRYSSQISPFAFSSDGKSIACISQRTIEIWHLETLSLWGSIEDNTQKMSYVIFSPDNRLLAVASGKYVKLWDPLSKSLCGILEGHTSMITTLKFSPNGQFVASGSNDYTVKLWDTMNIGIPEINATRISEMKFIGDGHYVVSYSTDETTELRDPSTGITTFTIPDFIDFRDEIEFSPLTNLLAYTDDDTIHLWNMATRKLYCSLVATDRVVKTIIFSPDGKNLAASYHNHAIVIWDLTTKKRRCVLKGHVANVEQLAFARDGRFLASGSMDSSLRLWDPATGKSLGILQSQRGPILAMAVSSDSRAIISENDKVITIWNTTTKQIIMEFDLKHKHVVNDAEALVSPPSLFASLAMLPLTAFDWEMDKLICPVAPLCVRQPWVVYELEDILWLPEQYRSPRASMGIHNDIIALGGGSNRLMIIKMNLKSIPSSD
ncbi:hypothetical protein ACJ72_01054 [Emergomyces africanus]|uniref:Uncharacterized protein n=1 Tax=Emergomyces africanus TaxID=1955775 RepID=A0A1B7P6A8_9EURO|nr:hypothetical protein ACJ72_01054 [Emergomyces africanus]